jgi:hypothetical protein
VVIRDTIVFRNKSGGEFGGITMNGQVRQVPFSGSNIVWAGPAGKPMLRFENTGGMYIHDLHLVGNSNPRNRPSAFIALGQRSPGLPPNRFFGISAMSGSALDGVFDSVDNGVYLEPGTVGSNDKFNNIRFFSLKFACFNNASSGPSGPDFSDVTCQHAQVGVYCVNGGRVDLSGATEILTVGQIFHLGGGGSVHALDVEPENDSPGRKVSRNWPILSMETGAPQEAGFSLNAGTSGRYRSFRPALFPHSWGTGLLPMRWSIPILMLP